jgi:hypothetical protein
MSITINNNWAAIKWIEDPPAWDTFPTKKLRGNVVVDGVVEAPWEGTFARAVVLAIGTCKIELLLFANK